MDGWNTVLYSFLLGWPIFRCYVSFREGSLWPSEKPLEALQCKAFPLRMSLHGTAKFPWSLLVTWPKLMESLVFFFLDQKRWRYHEVPKQWDWYLWIYKQYVIIVCFFQVRCLVWRYRRSAHHEGSKDFECSGHGLPISLAILTFLCITR